MSKLSKLDLNNWMVSMRHNVNRAKVQTVSNLTRRVKALRSKKASDNLKIKNENKADRLVDEVLAMKKITSDEVAAFSLSNTKDVDEILRDIESSTRLKALARLSVQKSISPLVQQFRLKYPGWQKEFPKVLVDMKKKSKKKKRKKKSERSAGNKPVFEETTEDCNLNVLEKFDKSKAELNSNDDDSMIESRSGRFSISCEDISTLVTESDGNEKIIDKSLKKQSKVNQSPFDIHEPIHGPNSKHKTNGNLSNNLHDKFKEDKKSEVVSANQNKVQKSFEPQKKFKINPVEKKVNRSGSPTYQIKKRKVDPFFLDNDNNPLEVTDFSSNRTNNNFEEDDLSENDNYNSYDNDDGWKKRKNQFGGSKEATFKANRFTPNKQIGNFKSGKFGFGKQESKGNYKMNQPDKSEIKLHPSWQAKKNMSTLANFQGKKVVFD